MVDEFPPDWVQGCAKRLHAILIRIGYGPLYGAFPVAAVMMKKGASPYNVMLFLGAWSTLKIPMFLFETQYLGLTFSVPRWISSLVGIVVMAFLIDRWVPEKEKQEIYNKHQ